MLDAKNLLLLVLAILAVVFTAAWIARIRSQHEGWIPTGYQLVVGFATNFFDTLGIGSFAPTAALYRARGTVSDERLPGTLNIGHCLPTVVQAFFFLKAVSVEPLTLSSLIVAAVVGAWFGAGVVARLSRKRIRQVMGIALLGAAVLMACSLLGLAPQGGEALGLSGMALAIALMANLLYGALMTVGVGAYAPMLTTVSLLGMNPLAAFPIMMSSCAYLTTVANLRFLAARAYDVRAAVGLTLGGVPAVILAATLVKSLPLLAVRWFVLVVVVLTAISLLRAAQRESTPTT